MRYVLRTPNSTGNHGAPDSNPFNDSVSLPEEFLDAYLQYNGFVHLTLEGDTVTAVSPNTEAWEAWKSVESEKPQMTPAPTPEDRIAALESAMLDLMRG